MTLKSLSTKVYLGLAVAALVMWIAGVSGRTILTLAAVGFMVAVHAGGHGGHGGGSHGGRGGGPQGGHADRDEADVHTVHTGRASAESTGAPDTTTNTGTRPAPRSGCH